MAMEASRRAAKAPPQPRPGSASLPREAFAALFQESPQPMAVSRLRDGALLAANDAFAALLGYPPAELAGAMSLDLGAWFAEAQRPAALERLLDHGELDGVEARVRTRAGEERAVRSRVRVAELGGELCAVWQLEDVTDRVPVEDALRAAEQARRASEERWRSVVQNAPDIVFTLGPDLRVQFLNRAAPGIDPARVVGSSALDLAPPEERERLREVFERVLLTGRPESYEVRGTGPAGQPAWYKSNVGPVRVDASGTGLVVVATDITEQKEAQEALEAALSLLRAALDSTADGLLIVDRQGTIRSFNRRFAQLWRIPDDILASRDDERAIAFVLSQLKDPDGFVRKVRELYAQPDAESFDVLEFRDGRVFERYSMPQRIGGASVGRVWSFRDVTEHRRAEAERLAAMERLQELERLKELDRFRTRFINVAAHELGTPLTPIKLQLHLLMNGSTGPLAPPQRKALGILDRNIGRLADLVQDVLEVARLQGGRLGIDRVPLDLDRVVLEAVDAFQEPARQAGLTLAFRPTPGLEVEADPKRLAQVMFNLLSNAVKFTPRGGQVAVETLVREDAAEVRVRDTGIGFREQDLPRLFQPFSQLEQAHEQGRGGTGLGLYISKGLVELHGGRIWAESPGPGHGAAFAFALPLRARRDASAQAEGRPPPPLGGLEPAQEGSSAGLGQNQAD
jgi:PAS domain S-box-containing protein